VNPKPKNQEKRRRKCVFPFQSPCFFSLHLSTERIDEKGCLRLTDTPLHLATMATSSVAASAFSCQRCRQPLRLQQTFLDELLDEEAQAEMAATENMAREAQRQRQGNGRVGLTIAHRPGQVRLTSDDEEDTDGHADHNESKDEDEDEEDEEDAGTRSFTLVDGQQRPGQSSRGPGAAHHARLRRTAELFETLTHCGLEGDLEHPLCEECADAMLEAMNQRLRTVEQEAQAYGKYLRDLEKETEEDSRVESLRKELEALETQEAGLKRELVKLKGEQAAADCALEEQLKAQEALEKEELSYWTEYSKYKRELLTAEDDYRSLECRLKYGQGQLDKLKKLNLFNATFNIWHSGHFATINGFRLGRLPSVPVEWSEINAAWGQTAFLLSSLAKAVGMKDFQRYQVVPYGNWSYVKVLADGKVLPLYGTGGLRMIFDSKFDSAMVAFLDCLQQFAVEVERQGGFSLPYEIDKGKIRDNNTGHYFSVKLQFNSEESWTKALRYMLTNLKWALAYVSAKYMKQEEAEEEAQLAEEKRRNERSQRQRREREERAS